MHEFRDRHGKLIAEFVTEVPRIGDEVVFAAREKNPEAGHWVVQNIRWREETVDTAYKQGQHGIHLRAIVTLRIPFPAASN